MNSYKILHPNVRETYSADSVVTHALTENRAIFLGFLIRKLQDRDRAEDIFQNFCVRAMNNASSLRVETRVVPWLYRVLHSTLSEFQRKDITLKTRDAEYARLQERHMDSPDDASLGGICCCLHQALPRLKHGYGDLLSRVDLTGHDRSAVATQLGLTSNNLAVRLHRARQALKRALLRMCSTCPEHGFLNCECGMQQDPAQPAQVLVL